MRPNLLVLGTFRAGTTWLFHALKQHPDVFLPDEKELMFFTHHYEKGIKWYESFFEGYKGEKYACDISPSYLSSKVSPARIHKELSDVKLIAILRNPVTQIWSLYNLWVTRNYTSEDFSTVLKQEKELLHNVVYFQHISNFLEFFNKENFLILFYEDLENDHVSFLNSIYNFLDIDKFFLDDFLTAKNKTKVPKSVFFDKLIARTGDYLRFSGFLKTKIWLKKVGLTDFIKSFNTAENVTNQTMPNNLREFIIDYIDSDVKSLSDIVDKDLTSFWKWELKKGLVSHVPQVPKIKKEL